MPIPNDNSFTRYLAAKKSVDDRALNRQVWQTLQQALPPQPLRVLEIGAGIGTMVERLAEQGMLQHADYTALDAQPENIAHARQRLSRWAAAQGLTVEAGDAGLLLAGAARRLQLRLVATDLFDFIEQTGEQWDVLIAHAFLDLVDLDATLPRILARLGDDGLFYFSLNFDGLTILEPTIDSVFDAQIMALYHQTMDERRVKGQPTGHSRTGRQLFAGLQKAGAEILAAGSSDWVVFARGGIYPQDEAYFLHFIVNTIDRALKHHPDLEPGRFAAWIEKRRAQIERGELVYIAHQLDFVGRKRITR